MRLWCSADLVSNILMNHYKSHFLNVHFQIIIWQGCGSTYTHMKYNKFLMVKSKSFSLHFVIILCEFWILDSNSGNVHSFWHEYDKYHKLVLCCCFHLCKMSNCTVLQFSLFSPTVQESKCRLHCAMKINWVAMQNAYTSKPKGIGIPTVLQIPINLVQSGILNYILLVLLHWNIFLRFIRINCDLIYFLTINYSH